MAAKKSTLILLVRHGKTPSTGQILPGRAKGLHLSELGQSQAEQAGKSINDAVNVNAIYTSPLERCRETAQPLSANTGIKPIVHKGLLECDFGDWTGASLKALNKKPEWKLVQQVPSRFRFPNGESFLEMQARITDTVDEIVENHPGEVVALFSHADPIKAALASALGTPLDLFQRINVSPCSVSAVLYGALNPAVITMNTATLSRDEFHGLV